MPKIAAGASAAVSIPVGSVISVVSGGGLLRFEFPTGTVLYEGDGSEQTFGPFTSTNNATITSLIGAVDYSVSIPPSSLETALADGGLFPIRAFKNFKPSNTRSLRKGLARVRSGSGRMNIACLGDSTTTGTGANTGTSGQVGAYPYSWPAQLKSILNSRLVASIDGAMWGQLNTGVVSYATFDPRTSFGAGWGTGPGGIAPMWLNNSTSNTLAFTPTEQVDTAVIWYLQIGSGGSFTVNVDGGATLATVNTAGSNLVRSQAVTFTKGAHTVNIARGASGDVYILGIAAYDSTTPSVSVWNWGWHGSFSSTWSVAANAWSPVNAIAAIAPDVLIYGVGINDMSSTTTAAFKANVQAVLTSALSAGSDCIIAIPNPVSTASKPQADQDSIRTALLELAVSNDLPVIDRVMDMESYTQSNTNGWMYDSLHPTKLGYGAVASLVAKALINAAG